MQTFFEWSCSSGKIFLLVKNAHNLVFFRGILHRSLRKEEEGHARLFLLPVLSLALVGPPSQNLASRRTASVLMKARMSGDFSGRAYQRLSSSSCSARCADRGSLACLLFFGSRPVWKLRGREN